MTLLTGFSAVSYSVSSQTVSLFCSAVGLGYRLAAERVLPPDGLAESTERDENVAALDQVVQSVAALVSEPDEASEPGDLS